MATSTAHGAQVTGTFDVLDVLTRAGDARERLADAVGEQVDALDALLVADVLAAVGRVGETLPVRRTLVDLCAILRALDAAERGMIESTELRDGLAAHEARTDRFEQFGDARVLLRTLAEVLDHDTAAGDALRTQVGLLHGDLRAYLNEQLTGRADGAIDVAAMPDEAREDIVSDPELAGTAHELVDELLHGADHHPVTGLLGAAWLRGWSAVPIPGEQLGEGDPAELERLANALATHLSDEGDLLLVDLRRGPRWQLVGRSLELRDGRRAARVLPATLDGLRAASAERPGWCVLTTRELDFAIVEGAGHHALLGPTELVTAACGCTPLEAVARFREHIEQLATDEDDEPPADLLDIADRFGRLRRRSR